MNKKDIMEKISTMSDKKFIKYYKAEDTMKNLFPKAVTMVAKWMNIEEQVKNNWMFVEVMDINGRKPVKDIYSDVWMTITYTKSDPESKTTDHVVSNYWCFYQMYKATKTLDQPFGDLAFFRKLFETMIQMFQFNLKSIANHSLIERGEAADPKVIDIVDDWDYIKKLMEEHSDEINEVCSRVMKMIDICWEYDVN